MIATTGQTAQGLTAQGQEAHGTQAHGTQARRQEVPRRRRPMDPPASTHRGAEAPARGRASAALTSLAIAATLLAALPARAQLVEANDPFGQPMVSWLGATTLPEGEQAFAVSAGLPDVEAAWLHGISSVADAAVRLRFQYGRGARVGGGGATVGATLRLHLGEFAGWQVALRSEPELMLHILGVDLPPTKTAGGMALALTPLSGGLTLSREVLPDLHVAVSLVTAVTLFAVPEAVLSVPLHAGFGFEGRLDKNLWLFTKVDTGIDFYGPGGVPGTRTALRAYVGLAFGG